MALFLDSNVFYGRGVLVSFAYGLKIYLF